MQINRLFRMISFIYFSILIRCSNGNVKDHEKRNGHKEIEESAKPEESINPEESKELTKPEKSNQTMSFSFDKENFNDFKCNFDSDLISSIYRKTPPFYISKNLNNFAGVFGLIFQYSLIKNNEEFRKVVENLYENYLTKVNDINEDKNINTFDPNNFANHLKNIDNIVKGILENEGNGMVKLKEKDGRMIIFHDNSSSAELFNLKLVEIPPKNITVKDQGNKNIVESMTEFYTKFYESYLSDSLNPGFSELFNEIFRSKNTVMKKQPIKETKPADDSFKFLLNSYSRFCQLINNESIDECKENPDKKTSICFNKYQQYLGLVEKLYLSGELPEYMKELIPKVKAKYAYEVTDISIDLREFFNYPSEYNTNIYTLSVLLEKALKDTKMISYGEEPLKKRGFNALMLRCLELVF